MESTENRNERMNRCGRRRPHAGWIVLGIIGITAMAALFGAIVMWLWNGLMPVIFHLGIITYWQAVGLAILGRLLFGGFHHGHHNRGHRNFGPWRRMHNMHNAGNCRDYSNGSKWSYYDQYWNEEGEQAFNDYLKRKGENQPKE